MIDKFPFLLSRNAFGRLVFTGTDGIEYEVIPVRAFPITSPDCGFALIDAHGHELAWIERLSDLPDELRIIVDADLAGREFMPEIKQIRNVSSFATPSTWYVETDRGKTTLILQGEEDIRRLTSAALLIADSHGIHFLIRDRGALDHHSRKLLDRFL
jgi:hypothetical protein